MIAISTLIISTLDSCSKDDPLPAQYSNVTTSLPITLNLTTIRWEKKAGGIFVNTFMNVIPAENANHFAKIYLVTDGKDALINQPIRFMDGELWATSTQTDIAINYHGSLQNVPYLNIKVVFD